MEILGQVLAIEKPLAPVNVGRDEGLRPAKVFYVFIESEDVAKVRLLIGREVDCIGVDVEIERFEGSW